MQLYLYFMHLADAFIQSDLHCIQVKHFLSVCVEHTYTLGHFTNYKNNYRFFQF